MDGDDLWSDKQALETAEQYGEGAKLARITPCAGNRAIPAVVATAIPAASRKTRDIRIVWLAAAAGIRIATSEENVTGPGDCLIPVNAQSRHSGSLSLTSAGPGVVWFIR